MPSVVGWLLLLLSPPALLLLLLLLGLLLLPSTLFSAKLVAGGGDLTQNVVYTSKVPRRSAPENGVQCDPVEVALAVLLAELEIDVEVGITRPDDVIETAAPAPVLIVPS
jgi:hypothetical protein